MKQYRHQDEGDEGEGKDDKEVIGEEIEVKTLRTVKRAANDIIRWSNLVSRIFDQPLPPR